MEGPAMDRFGTGDFYEAWWFLLEHDTFTDPIGCGRFYECLHFDVVKVNPENETAEENKLLNTAVRVWLECGPWTKPEELSEFEREYLPRGCSSHDPDLDCGAPTFEEAIIKLANLVYRKYGDGKSAKTEARTETA